MKEFIPSPLPLGLDLETKEILKAASLAHRALAELKGVAQTIPNQAIIINSLSLQEAKDSSEIENIITTHDELFLADAGVQTNNAVKEVQNYREALFHGFSLVQKNGFLSTNNIKEIQARLEQNDAGFRKQSGTILKNAQTGETRYIPPQNPEDIVRLMDNFALYFNDAAQDDLDPLVKMAILHYQFEAIHPFYDGNGRTGRILNILYLVGQQLLDIPILYLSRYIIKNKGEYYRLLNEVSFKENWGGWILYMLEGIRQTSQETIRTITMIEALIKETGETIQKSAPKIYSKDLTEALFYHPYTKISFLEERLGVHRDTASGYLKTLEKLGIVVGIKMGKSIYYVNKALFALLKEGGRS